MVGAGVLALPAVAAPVGYVPSSLALVGVWAYMSATGLLISGMYFLSTPRDADDGTLASNPLHEQRTPCHVFQN